MDVNRRDNPSSSLLLGFITVSLLLHLLLLALAPKVWEVAPATEQEPVVVEVRPPQPRPRELDLPVPKRETPRETPAKRLGPADQVVEKETAPKGEFPEDRAPQTISPPSAPPAPQPRPKPPREKESPAPAAEARRPVVERPAPPKAAESASETPKPETKPEKIPDLSTLTRLPSTTIARLEDQWRRKYREDVERGDAVWLDTEKDILFSFFQRFRNNIYNVWNYPPRAAERRQEGTCLLRVTINRRGGTVADVKVMESSGHRALDDEAVAAVWKGGPYGSLPKAYDEETLNVFAFFQYTLTQRAIY